MPSPSSASDSPTDRDPVDRGDVARRLYIDRDSSDAGRRCDLNTRLGQHDFTGALLEHLDLGPGMTLIDVGCGTGQHLERFEPLVTPGGRTFGFDFSADAIRQARSRGARAAVADGGALPLPDDCADAIHCAYAVYYLTDLPAAMRDWGRVLRPGGRVVVSGPAGDTNAELYAFHHAASGMEPSDADRMALGFVEGRVAETLHELEWAAVEVHPFENAMVYADDADFLAYWRSTSLFARTVDAGQEETVVARGAALLAESGEPMMITKRTSILVARST